MTLTAAGVVLAGWIAGFLLLVRLPVPAPARDLADLDLAVIVPARDEAVNVPALLDSLPGPRLAELIVVDDGSQDATASLARRAGARVVTAGPPPAGWTGKAWACATGVEATFAERLVLLDADVRLAPDALDRLVAEQDRRAPDGLLSVQPYHRVGSVAEQASLVPSIVALLASGVGAARPPHQPGLAFGPCLVTTRSALAAVGGFAAVRDELLEDAALAQAFEAAGRPVAVLAGGASVCFRMFHRPRDLVHGWTRTLAGGAGRSRAVPLVGAVLWVAALATVAVSLLHPTTVVALAYGVTVAQVGWMSRRVGSFHPLSWLLFPLPLTAFVLLFAGSVWQQVRRRPAIWRGRAVPRT